MSRKAVFLAAHSVDVEDNFYDLDSAEQFQQAA